ncbi:adenosylcobinamide-phosphate synthase [Formivibrio citricus]|uniref:Cobalamin biosynthesis protein CobD n=1 Tax=Formivibrio citricus TaxID=83765 RepID=A0A1I4YK23_9NEIS|nr:CobD/CbiB family protein [Formivibrio citricus]SFN38133.1 adenosylcobinamide-phosphate synthase [Formivibrio citricus]
MSILSLILALALEQFRPISSRNRFYLAFIRFANKLERGFNAGEYRNGVLAWCVAVLPLILVGTGGYWLFIYKGSVILALAWNVLFLYFTMGFRQFSHAFTGITKALKVEDLDGARTFLADWTGQSTSELTADEVAKLTIEQGVVDSYRYVFGTIFWFVALAWIAGPAGALVYRAACLLQQKWRGNEPFGAFATSILGMMDYIPVRLAAAGFAVMGDFEDAVYCWRMQAKEWADYDYGILLASGAGALGVRLGEAVHQDHTVRFRPELGTGAPACADDLPGAVGLVWRSVLLWLVVVLMLSMAQWLA